jgi:hypothetical protein
MIFLFRMYYLALSYEPTIMWIKCVVLHVFRPENVLYVSKYINDNIAI